MYRQAALLLQNLIRTILHHENYECSLKLKSANVDGDDELNSLITHELLWNLIVKTPWNVLAL